MVDKPDMSDSKPDATAAKSADAEPVTRAELAELRELTTSLLQTVGTLRTEDARAREFRGLIEDVRAAARGIAVPAPRPLEKDREAGCGCGPCGCLSSDCCLFEIVMTHARATEMQLPTEPFDSNVLPFGEMEVRFFASIAGVGAVIPNLWSTLLLRKNVAKPGLWSPVGVRIGTVTVCKGKPQTTTIDVHGIEMDEGGAEELGLRSEYGSGSTSFVLDCCMSVPFVATVDVQLNTGGLAGGAVEAKFEARKICC